MRITVNDSRAMAVAIVLPATDKFYNWATGGFETPFAAANHLRPLAPMETTPASMFSTVLSAELGNILIERVDAALLMVTVDTSGVPTAVVDVWTLPAPVPNPVVGGFSR